MVETTFVRLGRGIVAVSLSVAFSNTLLSCRVSESQKNYSIASRRTKGLKSRVVNCDDDRKLSWCDTAIEVETDATRLLTQRSLSRDKRGAAG